MVAHVVQVPVERGGEGDPRRRGVDHERRRNQDLGLASAWVSRRFAPRGPRREAVSLECVVKWIPASRILSGRMRAGRDFDEADVINRRPVALVNDAFVHRFFTDWHALDRTFSGGDSTPRTIIGVVSDAVYNSLREPTPPTAYKRSASPIRLVVNQRDDRRALYVIKVRRFALSYPFRPRGDARIPLSS